MIDNILFARRKSFSLFFYIY